MESDINPDKIAGLASALDAIKIPPTAVLRSEAKLSPSKARVEHRRRQDRLEQIRADLASQTVSKGRGESDKKHPSTTLGDEEEKTVSHFPTNYP